jgi:hypothetical protein
MTDEHGRERTPARAPMAFYPEHGPSGVQETPSLAEHLRAINSAALLLDTRGAHAFIYRTIREPRSPS